MPRTRRNGTREYEFTVATLQTAHAVHLRCSVTPASSNTSRTASKNVARPRSCVPQMPARQIAVLPVELVGPILWRAESAAQAVGQRVEIVPEVSVGTVDRPADFSVEVLDGLDLSAVDSEASERPSLVLASCVLPAPLTRQKES